MNAEAQGIVTPRLGKFLKEKRQAAKLNQKDISEQLGYNNAQFISNWERDKSRPPMTAIKVILEKYKIQKEELFLVMASDVILEARQNLLVQFEQL